MIDQTAVFGQFKGRVLHAYGLIYAAWLAVSDFMVDMFHAENIAKLGYRGQPGIIFLYLLVCQATAEVYIGTTGGYREVAILNHPSHPRYSSSDLSAPALASSSGVITWMSATMSRSIMQ